MFRRSTRTHTKWVAPNFALLSLRSSPGSLPSPSAPPSPAHNERSACSTPLRVTRRIDRATEKHVGQGLCDHPNGNCLGAFYSAGDALREMRSPFAVGLQSDLQREVTFVSLQSGQGQKRADLMRIERRLRQFVEKFDWGRVLAVAVLAGFVALRM